MFERFHEVKKLDNFVDYQLYTIIGGEKLDDRIWFKCLYLKNTCKLSYISRIIILTFLFHIFLGIKLAFFGALFLDSWSI